MKRIGFIFALLVVALLTVNSQGSCIAPSEKPVEFTGPNNIKVNAFVTVPAGDGPFPAIIMAHGGNGFDGPATVKSYLNVARNFSAEGFVVIAISYDATPLGVKSGKAMRQITDAIELAQSQSNVKADKISLWGFSSGGAAVLKVASDNPKLVSVVAVQPYLIRAPGTEKNIAIPVLLIGGGYDSIATVESLMVYEKSLKSQGKKVESFYGPWQHTFEYPEMTKRAAGFFVKIVGTVVAE